MWTAACEEAEERKEALRQQVQAKHQEVSQKQDQIAALRVEIIDRQKQGIVQLYNLLFTDKASDAKGYIHSIDHSEIMLHVLRQSGALSATVGGRIILSGKCPCPDCDAFITSNVPEINGTFDNSIFIGYNYGWRSMQEKSGYKLRCVQLTAPTKIGVEWSGTVLTHVSHMGTTPIAALHPHATELMVYVLGARFGVGATITISNCTAEQAGSGNYTIT